MSQIQAAPVSTLSCLLLKLGSWHSFLSVLSRPLELLDGQNEAATPIPEVPQQVQLPPASSSLRSQAYGASADMKEVSYTEATPQRMRGDLRELGRRAWGALVLNILLFRPGTGHPCV